MKRFMLVLRGEGSGCEYSIGCNVKVEYVNIENTSPDGLKQFILEEILDYYGHDIVKEAFIIPADSVQVLDVQGVKDNEKKIVEDLKAKAKEEHEKAEYASLKAKYERS